jgi:hypothetical protein
MMWREYWIPCYPDGRQAQQEDSEHNMLRHSELELVHSHSGIYCLKHVKSAEK